MNFSHYMGAFALIWLLCVTASNADGPEKVSEVAPKEQPSLGWKSLSFYGFLNAFGKKYSSLVERMARMKYYLASAFQTFQSIVRYQKNETTSYLSINQMSDWSPEEVRKLYVPHTVFEEDLDEDLKDRINDAEQDDKGAKQRTKRDIREILTSLDSWKPVRNDASLPDEVFIDHRRSNCFLQPRSQGHCGSCYAFALISLYEWVHCMKMGRLEALSEQYIIDCGHRYGTHGCSGGTERDASQFVAACGLELQQNYPYQGRQNECPYDEHDDDKVMGHLRAKEPRLKLHYLSEIETHLIHGPIIMIIATNDNFHRYGGGVDDAIGCDKLQSHAVLLVGHGRENGKQYWLFRNSFSDKFGEKGYYKLSKEANCLMASGLGHSAKAVSPKRILENYSLITNPAYDKRPIQRRQYETTNDDVQLTG